MRFEININLDNACFQQGAGKANLCDVLDAVSENIFVNCVDDLSPERKIIKDINGNTIGYWSIVQEPKDYAKDKNLRYYVEQVEGDPEYGHLFDRQTGKIKDVGQMTKMEEDADELNKEDWIVEPDV